MNIAGLHVSVHTDDDEDDNETVGEGHTLENEDNNDHNLSCTNKVRT